MHTFIAARYVIASDTFCAVAEETPAAATAAFAQLLARREVTTEGIDTTPRLALVDALPSPAAWAYVQTYYRVRHANLRHDDAGAYHVGDAVNLFEERDAAIDAARALDALGDDWDVCVVAFENVRDSGHVVWG